MKGKVDEVVKVGIKFGDGDEDDCDWPDKDLVLINGLVEGNRKREESDDGNTGDRGKVKFSDGVW